MKLLMIGDDFGMSKALTMGILDCINHGALRSTALIVNLKDSEFAASYIPKLTNCAFGLSFNSTKGKSILSKEEIPNLVDENGTFHSSGYYKKQEAYKTNGIGTCANYGVFVINWLRNAGAGTIEYASN